MEKELKKNPEPGSIGVREDILHLDPLLDCLVELTRIHGRPSTRAALVAGLMRFCCLLCC